MAHVKLYSRTTLNNVTMLAGLLHFTRRQDAAVMAGFELRLHVTKVPLLE
jgi:hypothetical protein